MSGRCSGVTRPRRPPGGRRAPPPRGDSDLREDGLRVVAHGGSRPVQPRGHLRGAAAVVEQLRDLAFARGQAVRAHGDGGELGPPAGSTSGAVPVDRSHGVGAGRWRGR